MGCNCKGSRPSRPRQAPSKPRKSGSKETQTFELTDQYGRTQTFGSRLEAKAANARAGGRGTIRPA